MKDYQQVVEERYDKQAESDFSSKASVRWMTSQLYMSQKLYEVLRAVSEKGHDLGADKILEVGCGGGRWTRFIAEITMAPENIKGTDLSGPRIEVARRMNPAIAYEVSDLVETPITDKYDIILAWDVFMHLRTEDQIRKALRNIRQALTERGVFIFFDAWASSHFVQSDAESVGFNPREIESLASSEGFKKEFSKDVFAVLPGGRHSEQYYGHIPIWLIRVAETVIPSPPGNYFEVFWKGG
jgi:2-polyprenyl-3-methyl-5-hydroxy-6-metoxy-1,4-benzoquinol methylase